MDKQSAPKYLLVNTETKKYFKGYEPTNKPIWTDTPIDATEHDEEDAQQIKRRLACQSQDVILISADRIAK